MKSKKKRYKGTYLQNRNRHIEYKLRVMQKEIRKG